MSKLVSPGLALAALGFLLSLVLHIDALTVHSRWHPALGIALRIGVALVCIPLSGQEHVIDENSDVRDFWRATFGAWPRWLLGAVAIVLLYYISDTFLMLASGPAYTQRSVMNSDRGISAICMLGYSLAFGFLYAKRNRGTSQVMR